MVTPQQLEAARNCPSAWKGLEKMYKQYITNNPQFIVEIGVDYGYSLFTLASDFPDAEVWGVDPAVGGTNYPQNQPHLHKHLPNFPNIQLVLLTSEQASIRLNKETVDLVHIDAIHTYKDTSQDIELWRPKVKIGGFMIFHDIVSFEGTGKAFRELSEPRWEIRDHCGLGIWRKM
jgi:predicted O-methyltransferase YrrM